MQGAGGVDSSARRKQAAARHRLKELLTVRLQSEGQRHRLPHATTQRAVLTHRGTVKREVDALLKSADQKAVDAVLEKLNSSRRVFRKDLLAINDPLVKTAVERLELNVFGQGGRATPKEGVPEHRAAEPLTARNLEKHTSAYPPHPPVSARGSRTGGRGGSGARSHISDYSSVRSSRVGSRMSSVADAVATSQWNPNAAPAQKRVNIVHASGAMTHRGAPPSRHMQMRSGHQPGPEGSHITRATLRQLDRALFSKISQRVSGRNICIRAFRFFDRSKRNRIEYDDFKEVCVELGMGMSEREMRELFRAYDMSGVGAVSFEDFKRTLMNMGAQPGIATWSEEVHVPQKDTRQHALGDADHARDVLRRKATQRGWDRFQLQKAFRQFVETDTDEIDEPSFSKACRAVGSNFADADLHALFQQLAGGYASVPITDLVAAFYVPAQHK